jgi:hypothetical protein
VTQKHGEEIGERHLELLRVVADLARNDPAAVAQRMNLNTVGKRADRAVFLPLVRDLEGAGCVEARGAGLAASCGMLSVTEEGHRQLAAPKSLSGAPGTVEEGPERAEQPRPASGGAQKSAEGPWWRRMFGGG